MSSASSELPPCPRLVLRAGITGHRPVPGRAFDIDAVAASLRDVMLAADATLLSIHSSAYEHGHVPQLTLISALAAGADQMATEAFQSLPKRTERTRCLEVILPFSVDDYAGTIDDAKDAERMRFFADEADRLLVLSDFQPPPRDSKDKVALHRQNRRYETVGKMVVHQADFLIAVWDGNPSVGTGGTGDVVLHALRSAVPVVWIDLAGRKQIIPAGKMRGDEFEWIKKKRRPFTTEGFQKLLEPALSPPHEAAGHGEEKEAAVLYRLHQYLTKEPVLETTRWGFYQLLLGSPARRLIAGGASGKAKPRGPRGLWHDVRRSWRIRTDYVLQAMGGEWKGYPFADRSAEQIRFARAWAAADAIATALGHAYRSTYVLVMAIGFAAVTFGLVGIVFHENEKWYVAVELIMLFIALRFYIAGRKGALHERWLQAREIAEQMRATWAPMLLGVGGRRSSHDGKNHWSAWLTNAYLAEAGLPKLEICTDTLGQVAQATLDGIAKDQSDYHATNAKVLRAIHHRLEKIGRVALTAAIVNSSLLFCVVAVRERLQARFGKEPIEFVVHTMAALSALLPALGATTAALRYQGDFERFSKRSEQTSSQLSEVSAALESFLKTLPSEADAAAGSYAPKFEDLLEILAELESGLISDLDDWRFVYVTRGVPEPG